METRKLYYEDSHLERFTAAVVSCEQTEKGYEVVLDATAFYPEGGGQAADTGTLGGVPVLFVKERDNSVVHLCGGPLEPGSTVDGVIDYAKRFARMQQHSGEHMVSGVIHRRYGWHNVGFHMGSGTMEIDFDGVVPQEDLASIESEVNEAIWRNIPLHIWTPEPEELAALSYRTKRELPWPVRIVEVPGFDVCACCGTHVSTTGEIGLVKLYSAVPCRGGTRIQMACGRNALEMLNRVYEENRRVSRICSAQITETGDAVQALSDLAAAQKFRIGQMERQLFRAAAKEYAGAGDVLRFEPELGSTGVRELADAIAEVCGGTAAVFSGSDGSGYSFCLVAREGDLRTLGKEMTAALGGRGGGKPAFQQGSVSADRTAIEAFFAGRSGKRQ